MRVIVALLVALLLSGPLAVHAGEPYAPKSKVLPGIEEGSVPYLGLEVPLYPGAKILRTSSGVKMTFNNEEVTCLHTVQLLTTDEHDKVKAFYKKQLKGYRFNSQLSGDIRGLVAVFWKNPYGFNIRNLRQACTTPSLLISKEKWSQFMPEAKTLIEIVY